MTKKVKALFIEEEGQGMTEYGLILGLIALAAVVAMTAFGSQISKMFQKVTGQITG